MAAVVDLLAEATRQIAKSHSELATLMAREHENKVKAWFSTVDEGVTARGWRADRAALDLSTEVTHLRGDLRAAEAKRDFYVLLLGQGVVDWERPL